MVSALAWHCRRVQDESILEKWIALARMGAAGSLDAVLKAVDDPKVFVFGELLDEPNVQVRVWCGVVVVDRVFWRYQRAF